MDKLTETLKAVDLINGEIEELRKCRELFPKYASEYREAHIKEISFQYKKLNVQLKTINLLKIILWGEKLNEQLWRNTEITYWGFIRT